MAAKTVPTVTLPSGIETRGQQARCPHCRKWVGRVGPIRTNHATGCTIASDTFACGALLSALRSLGLA